MMSQVKMYVLEGDGKHTPEPLKGEERWALWNGDEKIPRAPWETGHMYPAEWGKDSDANPMADYKTAKRFAGVSKEALHKSYPFPEEPEEVYPTIFLKHYEREEHRLCQIDFDDVRDPETGETTKEVAELVEKFDAFTEISTSGKGIHIFVRATLPKGLGKFIADLDGKGQIEIYDHGRFVGFTREHVEGTPEDRIPEAQMTVDAVIDRYATPEHRERMERAGNKQQRDERTATEVLGEMRSSSGQATAENPYYSLSVEDVAQQGPFAYHSDGNQGPHPGHGGTSTPDTDSKNFVAEDGDGWYCFAHEDGGGALQLVAVLNGVVSCGNSDEIYTDRRKLLKTCLHAKDEYTVLEDENPPYDALVAVAEWKDIEMQDPENKTLGKQAHRIASIVYEDMEVGDV